MGPTNRKNRVQPVSEYLVPTFQSLLLRAQSDTHSFLIIRFAYSYEALFSPSQIESTLMPPELDHLFLRFQYSFLRPSREKDFNLSYLNVSAIYFFPPGIS